MERLHVGAQGGASMPSGDVPAQGSPGAVVAERVFAETERPQGAWTNSGPRKDRVVIIQRQNLSYCRYMESRSVLLTLYSTQKCLFDAT